MLLEVVVETDSGIIYDDPVWEYVVVSKLQPYLPAARKWWANYDNLVIRGTGIYPIEFDDGTPVPPGMDMRMTNTPVRSPIKNVQAFPFVPTQYFQITGVPGGATKMITRVCNRSEGLILEEFTIVEKHNLPSTYHKGQFVAFIPTEIYKGAKKLGKYVYLTVQELQALSAGVVLKSVSYKCTQYALE